jgi:hypothetical protein
MTLLRRTSQAQAVRPPGWRVTGELPPPSSVLPSCSTRRASAAPATCKGAPWRLAWPCSALSLSSSAL